MTAEEGPHNTQSDSSAPGADGSDAPVSPAEFTERMPEGESAGPGAPETLEATQGHGGDAGPGGSQMRGMGRDAGRKNAEDDAHHDPLGAAALAGRNMREGIADAVTREGGTERETD